MTLLAALFVGVTTVYLFSCWQVNRAVRDYYRLKADWDRECEAWRSETADILSAPLTWPPAQRDGPTAGGSMEP